MSGHSLPPRGRTCLAGKIISNFGQSSIDCIIRRISDDGATIEVAKSDIVGRLGGEEFAILLPEADLAQATIVADRLCKAIAEQVMIAHEVQLKVTASIGIAAASVSMSGLDALMQAADQALYQAKAQGRNCVVPWSPPEAPKLAAE